MIKYFFLFFFISLQKTTRCYIKNLMEYLKIPQPKIFVFFKNATAHAQSIETFVPIWLIGIKLVNAYFI